MRVLVCGGRMFGRVAHDVPAERIQAERERAARERRQLHVELDRLHTRQAIALVIQGGAAGADTIARDWSLKSDIPCATVEADWSLGRRAGPIRNAKMLRECQPNLVLAFKGGRGTQDCVRQARAAGVPVVTVGWFDE